MSLASPSKSKLRKKKSVRLSVAESLVEEEEEEEREERHGATQKEFGNREEEEEVFQKGLAGEEDASERGHPPLEVKVTTIQVW